MALFCLPTGVMAQGNQVHEVFDILWENYVGITTFRTTIQYADGMVYVPSNGQERNRPGDDTDGLYRINAATGRIQQHINVEGSADEDCNGVALFQDKMFFGGDDGRFYCYKTSGELLWKTELHRVVELSPRGEDDVEGAPVLVDITGDGYPDPTFNVESHGLVALDGKTGTLLWSFQYASSEGTYMNSPASADLNDDGIPDFVIGGKRDKDPSIAWDYRNAVYAINGSTGAPLWQYNCHSNIHASPVLVKIHGERAVMCAESYSDILFLDPSNGQLLKFVNLNLPDGAISGLFASPIITDHENLVIGTSWWGGEDGIWICDVDEDQFVTAPDGLNELQKKARRYVETGKVSSTAVCADVLPDFKGKETLVCTESGYLFIFDAKGTLQRRLQLPAGVEATPFIGDIDRDKKLEIVIACLNGKVYCYKTKMKARKRVHWGSFRGNVRNTGSMTGSQRRSKF